MNIEIANTFNKIITKFNEVINSVNVINKKIGSSDLGDNIKIPLKIDPGENITIIENNSYILNNMAHIHVHTKLTDQSTFNSYHDYLIGTFEKDIVLVDIDSLVTCAGNSGTGLNKWCVPGVGIVETYHKHDNIIHADHHIHVGVSSSCDEILINGLLQLKLK